MARIGDSGSTVFDANFTRFAVSQNADSGSLSGSLVSYGLTFLRASAGSVKTGASTAATGIPVNTIRIGCSGSTNVPALVFEERRENLALYATAINSWSAVGLTVSSSALLPPEVSYTAPNGTETADVVTENRANNVHTTVQTNATLTTGSFTMSAWLKPGSVRYVGIRWSTAAGREMTVDLASASVTTTTNAASTWGDGTPNGWINVGITNVGTVGASSLQHFLGSTGGIYGSYLGTESTAMIWGTQFERGAFPTEFIETVASPVTRQKEFLYHPDVTQLIDDGQLALEICFVPKGDFPSHYTEPVRLWTIDENNYMELNVTGSVAVFACNGLAVNTAYTLDRTKKYNFYMTLSTGSENGTWMTVVSSSAGEVSSNESSFMQSMRLPSGLTGSICFFSDKNGDKALSAWIEFLTVYKRARNVPDLELPSTRHSIYARTNRIRPFRDRGPRR